MTRLHASLALMLGAALLGGCSEGDPVGVDSDAAGRYLGAQASHAAGHAVPDVSGAWNWSSVERVRMPRWFVEAMAPLLGIVPEGENTHALCESAGTMTLAQTGTGFAGTASKTSNSCETVGGQAFQQPGTAFQVADGRITGKSIRFSFHSATVRPCPHHAVISDVENGLAAALDGSGHCVLPGHPRSESPIVLDPPPGGTTTTLNWQAWRP